PLWVSPMAPDSNKPLSVEWNRLRMRDSIASIAGVWTSRFAEGSAALAAGIKASRTSIASGCCCDGSRAPEDGGNVLLAGAGAELPLAGPMMLLMTWSAAFCAAAAGKYTLMVTQPANNASMAATANRGLRIRNLQGAKAMSWPGDRFGSLHGGPAAKFLRTFACKP